jgi:hypothetical protein
MAVRPLLFYNVKHDYLTQELEATPFKNSKLEFTVNEELKKRANPDTQALFSFFG